MLEDIKSRFFQFIRSLNYKCSDNGVYRDEFPWLMLRTGDANIDKTNDLTLGNVKLILDIFSTYNGEKEILDILDDINDKLHSFIDANADIQYASMKSLRIIGDKETGPVRKHGIATYSFNLTKGDEVSDGD